MFIDTDILNLIKTETSCVRNGTHNGSPCFVLERDIKQDDTLLSTGECKVTALKEGKLTRKLISLDKLKKIKTQFRSLEINGLSQPIYLFRRRRANAATA